MIAAAQGLMGRVPCAAHSALIRATLCAAKSCREESPMGECDWAGDARPSEPIERERGRRARGRGEIKKEEHTTERKKEGKI